MCVVRLVFFVFFYKLGSTGSFSPLPWPVRRDFQFFRSQPVRFLGPKKREKIVLKGAVIRKGKGRGKIEEKKTEERSRVQPSVCLP